MGNRIKQYVIRHLSFIQGAGSVLDIGGVTWNPSSPPKVRRSSFSDDAAALNRDWVKHFPEHQREASGEHQHLLFQ
jgi:hypothetical protein